MPRRGRRFGLRGSGVISEIPVTSCHPPSPRITVPLGVGGGAGGQKPRPPRPQASKASPPAGARHGGHGQVALHSGSRAPRPRARGTLRCLPGQQVPPGLGPPGVRPPQPPSGAEESGEGCRGGSGAWGGAGARSPSSILRRAEEGKAGLGADRAGHFSGSGRSTPGTAGLHGHRPGAPCGPSGSPRRAGLGPPLRRRARPPAPSRAGRSWSGGAGGER